MTPRAGLDHPSCEDVEVLRRRHVEEAPIDVARQTRVRLYEERQTRAAHPLRHRERELRTVSAVHADHLRAEVAKDLGDLFRRRAVGDGAFGVERRRRDDRELRRTFARGPDGDADLVEVAEGLDHEQVGAALGERGGLFDERAERVAELGIAVRAGEEPGRSDRSCDVRIAVRDLACDLRALEVEALHLADEAVSLEPEAVSPERVRLENIRARLEIILVNALHDVGPRDVELLEVLRDEDASLVEQRAHRAVGDEERAFRGVEERRPIGGDHRKSESCHGSALGAWTLTSRGE